MIKPTLPRTTDILNTFSLNTTLFFVRRDTKVPNIICFIIIINKNLFASTLICVLVFVLVATNPLNYRKKMSLKLSDQTQNGHFKYKSF